MKTKFCVCTIGYDGQQKILRSFRNRPEAIAFANDEKNVRQFGDMSVEEKTKHPDLGIGEERITT